MEIYKYKTNRNALRELINDTLFWLYSIDTNKYTLLLVCCYTLSCI